MSFGHKLHLQPFYLYDVVPAKRVLKLYMVDKGPDQPKGPCSLIKVFIACLYLKKSEKKKQETRNKRPTGHDSLT